MAAENTWGSEGFCLWRFEETRIITDLLFKMESMKYGFYILVIFFAYRPALSQSIVNEDSLTAGNKIYHGEIESNEFEGGHCTYTVVASDFCNYVEISTVYWKTICVKYRLEKLSSEQIFHISKMMLYEKYATPGCYIAIDSISNRKFEKLEKGVTDLSNEKSYVSFRYPEPKILALFVKLIFRYNLQFKYVGFKPKSFVAWMRIKN